MGLGELENKSNKVRVRDVLVPDGGGTTKHCSWILIQSEAFE